MRVRWRMQCVLFLVRVRFIVPSVVPTATWFQRCCCWRDIKRPRLNRGHRAFAEPWRLTRHSLHDTTPLPRGVAWWGSTSGQPLSGASTCANHVFMCHGAPWHRGRSRWSRSGGGGVYTFLFFSKRGRRPGRGGLEGKRDKRGRGPLMRALARIIMGLADRNQDLSQRSQLTPSPLP